MVFAGELGRLNVALPIKISSGSRGGPGIPVILGEKKKK